MQPSRRGFLGGLIAAPVVAPGIAKSVAADLAAPRRGTLGLSVSGMNWGSVRARAVGGNAGSAESVGIDLISADEESTVIVERRVIRPLYPHPSGRPIRRTVVKERPIWRIPDTESNVPRLRRRDLPDAIGFIHDFDQGRDDEDE